MRFIVSKAVLIAAFFASLILCLPATDAAAQGLKPDDRAPPGATPTPNTPAPGAKDPGAPGSPPKKDGQKDAPKSATPAPNGTPQNPGAPGQKNQAGNAKKAPPPIAVQQPRTPAEREKALNDLYAMLATADDEKAAQSVASSIERLWLNSGSDTVAVLMDRAMQAAQAKKTELALKLLDSVTQLAPDYAEGWNRRAYVHYGENNVERAVGDLRRVLALDPNHFKALDGLAHILKDVGQKKAALAAVRKLLEVHPYWDGAKAMHDELAKEVEGQAL